MQLEHSTLPPYLYALYSLVPGKNDRIAEIIQSVAFEEMLHMTLACNLINALGGSPTIDAPGFIPIYPGPLPGGVESQLCVSLAPFSMDQLENVPQAIEKPEDPIEFEAFAATTDKPVTIGMFYDRIKAVVSKLPDERLHGKSEQPGRRRPDAGVGRRDRRDERGSGHRHIVDQGEGTAQDPMDSVDGESEPAHYYRFAEIWHGHELEATGAPPTAPVEERYAYTGAEIPFDPDGVQPVRANPTEETLPLAPGVPNPKFACQTFNYTYTALLKSLHTTFNGDPSALTLAVGLMESLKEQAIALMAIPLGDGTNAGPSFEYTPVLAGPVLA